MRKILSICLLLFICNAAFSQSKKSDEKSFIFLPAGLNFMPLRAGIDEPRMGILYYTATKNLKVDIGNSFDVFQFNLSSTEKITIGAEFMAYAYVTNYLAYRLQIDAIDGLFGGNIIYSKSDADGRWVGRFRYIHNSAHLVDGHWDTKTDFWIDDYAPEVYGNNYGELLLARESGNENYSMRYYGGASMSTGNKTGSRHLKKFAYKTGFEFALTNLLGKVLNKNENIFCAVNMDFRGIPEYIVNQNYEVGIKFGSWNGKGISVFASYYNGGDVFNEYFQRRVSRFGIGFTFDFI